MATLDNASIKNNNLRHLPAYLPWLVVFSAALFFFYEFIQMQMFNAISHSLLAEFHISATTLGYVSSSYFLADVIFLFPAGMLLDRFSARKVILTAMWICVLSTALLARSHSIGLVALCHFAAGIGNAFCFLSCIRLASHWFPNRQMALVVGLIVTMAMLGGVVAQTPLAWLTAQVGWRDALMITAGLGFVIIAIVWRFVKDYPPGKAQQIAEQKQQLKTLGIKQSIVQVFRNPQNWLCGFYTSFINVPLMLLGGLWGSLYLTAMHQITPLQASYITSMIFFGTMIGCPVIGAYSDYIARRRMPMFIAAAISLPVMLGIIFLTKISLIELLILFFALGFFTAAQTIGYPTISESNNKSITGTAMGLASVLIMGAPMVFEPLFGWLMDKNWDGKVVGGTHVYSAQAYHYPMLFLFGILLLGTIFPLFVRETYAKEKIA